MYVRIRLMNKAAIVLLLSCMTIGSAGAMFVGLSDSELVEQSDLIVVGELIGRARIGAPGGRVMLLGVIKVDETLKGDRDLTVVFIALPDRRLMSSSDVPYSDGQRGLWYLYLRDVEEEGIFLADHPQRFMPIDEAAERIAALRSPGR
jgi:hypothetical protein